ncbi:SDR family NAD(P)-dependent oxidoreductase [methanotrophic endosymbiont of Bathymodiolus puteoserpentis (Logatchev)]|jgi:NAD(P)-dependent dehydrogenase (short-subunit alcohol dehydrogenase family)|uniref:SDR family NAD(P)-dependent oxidoreductase n=1 Tax=methanotrophic endosymbiont of Bathymodiolus puteoserpentis (Logatchev) TaxID=343235 RepID=UPI0013C869BB|nr:SDR family NAD(P)-dependent oxidoreductase [methanotrophic endosymbiont of Bathymodiolus puteoserpentis (Logatchev)]SHE21883.1 Short-chain dehydrogenase, associated with 2-hydroxychromene-2-carboxylate isomerase family protein [methanotrophic endosymbiont of Bathymodiolus puteoserpentis (Logatchev)]
MSPQNSAVIIGVGPERGLGATLAKHFAAQGLHVYIAGRSGEKLQQVVDSIRKHGGQATSVVADATQEYDINHLFDAIHFDESALQLAVYNVDSNIPAPILETKSETFTALWQQNCLGAFLFAKEAIECMQPNKQGTLIFTGATASLRAKPPFTAFASAKAALRSLAQGLAREFSPAGIHVVHTIIDGVINGDRAAQQFPEYYQSKGEEGLLKLEAIAETYWAMHCQHPSAWTHELDLRPFKEPF